MRPKKLRLSNWCQHREKEIILSDGMNSIQGPNGSGKSNILDAVLMALAQESNNCNAKSDRKTDNISHGEDRARVELEFEHQDQQGLITVDLKRNYHTDYDVLNREMTHAKQVLAAHGEEHETVTDEILRLASFKPRETVSAKMKWGDLQLRNSKEVQEWMLSVTHMNPRAMREAYFPNQGNVDAVIAGSGEERYRALAEQAGITLCARIHQYLGDEIRAQPDFSGVDAEMRELEAREAHARGNLVRAQEEHEKWQGLKIDVDSLRDTLAAYAMASKAQANLQEAQQRLIQARQATKDLEPSLTELLAKGKALALSTEEAKADVEAARDTLSSARQAEQSRAQLETARQRLKTTQEELSALQKPGEEPVGDPGKLRAEIAHLKSESKQNAEWMALFESGECPTCGQEVADASQKIEEFRRRQPEIEQMVLQLTEAIRVFESQHAEWRNITQGYNAQSSILNERLASINQQIKQLEEGLQQLPDQQALGAASALVTGYTQEMEKLQALREQYNQQVALYDRANAEAKTAEALVAANQAQLEGSPTDEEAQKASAALSQAQLDQQSQRDAGEEYRVKKALHEQAKADLDRVSARHALAQPTREWVSLLGKTRDLYHRDALPREAVLWYASQLIEHANFYLGFFEAKFQMTMTEDMTFLAVFGDKVLPGGRLSGGEKNMLSICIRMSMADLFPSDLRLLTLDEVEVHLDQENVARLPIVLEQVKGLARNRGLTVLFVSHHPSLSDVSDHVIHAAA